MKLDRKSLKEEPFWQQAGFEVPIFDYEEMLTSTYYEPIWLHFGAGNIFRGFLAALQQKLLDEGRSEKGIIAVAPHDQELIEQIYKPYDNLNILIHMLPDGSLEKKVIGSVAQSLVGDPIYLTDWQRLKDVFCKPSLQMVSLTVTEKAYSLTDMSGQYHSDIKQDMSSGPHQPKSFLAKLASLLYERYFAGELPVALVSMDNCSHNGDNLKKSLLEFVTFWVDKGFVHKGYIDYINNCEKVAFPCTMIDKITPSPSEKVKNVLLDMGIEDLEIICTKKKTHVAPFVNAEKPQYLVIEDWFPNGRPQLEYAGVYFTDKTTVERVEKMKVTTCLNPLHTALAVFGCLLGYTLIADEMKNIYLKRLVDKIGYDECMPVVVNPGIIEPKVFIDEIINERLPNPYIPDKPQRIACDTSQKIPVRYGETIKTYFQHPNLDVKSLTYIPLVIAGWFRYLMGVDDMGNEMTLSPDPMLNELRAALKEVELGNTATAQNCLKPLLSNERIFGMDLYKAGLGCKIEGFFIEMISGKNAVQRVLEKYLTDAVTKMKPGGC